MSEKYIPTVTAHRAQRNVKRARSTPVVTRIPSEEKASQRVKDRTAENHAAARRARSIIPDFANVGELSILCLPKEANGFGWVIPYPDADKSLHGLPTPSPITLLRTLAVFAASGVSFNELAIPHPLRVLIVTTRDGVAADLARIVETHSLFPRERITVHRIGYDSFGAFGCGDLGRVARVVRPSIIIWEECSIGVRELALPFLGDVRAAHLIATDIRPLPQPPRAPSGPLVEVYKIFDIKERAGTFRIIGEDKKLRAAFTVAHRRRIEPVPVKDQFNFKARLSAARGEDIQVDETENES